MNEIKRQRSESGSMLLFAAAVVLPILILLVTMGLEVGNVFSTRSIEQKVVDSTALYAIKQFPHRATAAESARTYLLSHSGTVRKYGIGQATISTTSDTVSVELRVPFSFPLAKYFNFSGSFFHKVRSQARIQPKDVAIYFDSSTYMMPDNMDQFANDPNPDAGLWWSRMVIQAPQTGDWDYNNFFVGTNLYSGDDVAQWKEARFFRFFNGTQVSFKTATKRTQICFNPIFSAMKEAAIKLYYANSQFNLNSVGIFTGPAQFDPTLVYQVRGVRKGGYYLGQSEGMIEDVNFNLPGSPDWRDRHCLAAAQQAQIDLNSWKSSNSGSLLTSLPPPRLRHAFPNLSPETDSAILNHNGAGVYPNFANLVNGQPNFTLWANNLSVREAVWARRAYPYLTVDQQTSLGINNIITSVGIQLLQADPRLAERGDLAATTTKQMFIMLGNFPRTMINGSAKGYESATLAERQLIRGRIIGALNNLHFASQNLPNPLSIYITMLGRADPGLRDPVTGDPIPCLYGGCNEFEEAVDEIADAIEAWEVTHPKVRVTFERIMNQVGLPSTWVSHMSLAERQVYLSN